MRTPARSPKSVCAGCRQQGHAGSKTMHKQNPPVLNWRCRLTQVNLYNGLMAVKSVGVNGQGNAISRVRPSVSILSLGV